MKKWIIVILFIFSIGANAFMLGQWLLFDQYYEPSKEEKVILGEMIVKTIESEDYKKISENEKVISVEPSIDKNKGGPFPHYFSINVRTEEQTYMFFCSDELCTEVVNEGWGYSRYKDEKTRIPFVE